MALIYCTTAAFVSVTNSLTYANMGANIKSGAGNLFELRNSIAIGGCHRMAEPVPGAPDSFNKYLSDFCRAAGDIPVGFDGTQPNIETKLIQLHYWL
jgi:hypothetical protein